MTIEKKIRAARPKLSLVYPWISWAIVIFAWGNIGIAYSLWTATIGETTRNISIVNDLLTFQIYAVAFALIGIIMLYGWWKNDWEVMKATLIIGLFLKSVWAIALVFSVIGGGNSGILVIWLMLVALQSITYIFFRVPGEKANDK